MRHSRSASTQSQAINRLAGFNGQIKSKDDVTVGYQLMATGQDKPVLQNALNGKAKSDGEDVLTPLLLKAAEAVLSEVAGNHPCNRNRPARCGGVHGTQ